MSEHNHYVDGRVLDAVTFINTAVLGSAPAMANAQQSMMMSYNLSLAGLNAVAAQNHSYPISQASTVAGVVKTLG